MSRGVQVPVNAKLNDGDLDSQLKQLTQKINALGQSIAQANKVKFNPITKASLDDLKRMQDQFEKLKRMTPLGADISRTGQGSKSFFDIDWNAISSNSVAREARRYGAFNKAFAGTGASFSNSAPPSSSRGPRREEDGGRPSASESWWRAGRTVVGGALKGAGPAGATANDALSAGLSGGAMAGIAGLIGGVVALGVGKAIGGVVNKIGDAQNDVIGYDTLKRSLGDVNVSFNLLRESLHASADAIDATYPQILKMGSEFARISGMSGEASKTLAEEVRVGGGFGRSFGMDPEQSNAFFAQMRQFQVTGTESDSRRLALYVGEAVAKAGAFSKTDEMLQAIASYTSQQTRMGLSSANVGDYAGMLSGLVGSHTPGLDPMGSANLLSRVNSAISQGGNAGEAGQNFTYMAIGRQLGLDPIQSAILQEQGAFGTGAQTFGQGSLYSRFAHQYGLSTPGMAAGSDISNVQMVMRRLQSTYVGNPELMLDAMSKYFGVDHNQAMALATIKPDSLGGLQKALQASGVDVSKMSFSGLSALAQITSGSRSTLNDQARQIWPQLSSSEQGRLEQAANSGDDEKLRTALLQLVSTHGQADTEGSETRKTIQDLDKDLIDQAGKLLGPLNQMRDIMLFGFGDRGKLSAADIHKRVIDAQKQNVNDEADAKIKTAQAQYGAIRGTFGKSLASEDPEQAAKNKLALAQAIGAANWDRWQALNAIDQSDAGPVTRSSAGSSPAMPAWMNNGGGSSPGAGGANGDFLSKYSSLAQRVSQQTGISPKAILAQIAVETNWGKKELPGSFNPFNIQKGSWQGPTVSAMDTHGDGSSYGAKFRAYSDYGAAADDYSSVLARGYSGALNSGDNIDKFANALQAGGYAENPHYAQSIESAYAKLNGTPLPDTGTNTSTSGGTQSFSFNHTVTLQYPNGTPAAAPLSITKNVTAPTAFGS